VIGKREDILDAIVLTDSKREVQIMNPKTYATAEVRKPPGYSVTGETVRVLVYEEDVFLLP
jgi:NMD protein affecting ribosome stability and mRNA decay